jgi:hypothetical protein
MILRTQRLDLLSLSIFQTDHIFQVDMKLSILISFVTAAIVIASPTVRH